MKSNITINQMRSFNFDIYFANPNAVPQLTDRNGIVVQDFWKITRARFEEWKRKGLIEARTERFWQPTPKKMTLKEAREIASAFGGKIGRKDEFGDYRVTHKQSWGGHAYLTDDLDDAVGTAKMAAAEFVAACKCPMCGDHLGMVKQGSEVITVCTNSRCGFTISLMVRPELIALVTKNWSNSLWAENRRVLLGEEEKKAFQFEAGMLCHDCDKRTVGVKQFCDHCGNDLRMNMTKQQKKDFNESLKAIPANSTAVNKKLAQLGIEERLVRGNGYYYFTEGRASSWYSSSVPVFRINSGSIRWWLEQYALLRWGTSLNKGLWKIEYRADSKGLVIVNRDYFDKKNFGTVVFTSESILDVINFLTKEGK